MALLIRRGQIYTSDQLFQDGALLIAGERIAGVGSEENLGTLTRVSSEIDAGNRFVLPGFIDIQVNGAGGSLFTDDPTIRTLEVMSGVLASYGCTSFLPTVISTDSERIVAALTAVNQAMRQDLPGASILGCHLEGPFINSEQAGVHSIDSIRLPSPKEFSKWMDTACGAIKLLTIAPELPGTAALIEEALRWGVTVAAGHTTANYAQIMDAKQRGVNLVTHIFNAMGEMRSREPGTAGAALTMDGLSVTLIADGFHIHPAMLELVVRAKGTQDIILISDAMPPLGTDMSHFELYGKRVDVHNGQCLTRDNKLAGSVLSMDRAVYNMHQLTDLTLAQTISMATINPARIIHAEKEFGTLEKGKMANLLICDSHLNVDLVLVAGRIVYRSTAF